MMKPTALALHADLTSVRIGQLRILSDILLPIRAGGWTAIVGPNGAGKSSLLRCLAGLWPSAHPRAHLYGRVMHAGVDVQHMASRARARQIAWLGQGESVAPDLSVHDVVLLGRLPQMGWLGSPQPEDEAAAEEALRATQTLVFRDRLIGQLSVGQRQQVFIARALATQAPIILMDEPLAHLDAPHQADWLALVRQLTRTRVGSGGQSVTIVSVLHELTMALQADDIVVMKAGRLMHCGGMDAAAWRAVEAVFDQRLTIQPTPWGPLVHYPQSGIGFSEAGNEGATASPQAADHRT